MAIHELLDWRYGPDGDEVLGQMLRDGADVAERRGSAGETPLHVAARRRRCSAIRLLLDHGAPIDAKTSRGKTAFAHAARRGFDDVAELLRSRGADPALATADLFAIAVLNRRFAEARSYLERDPMVARTGNPEEDRLLADAAGRNHSEPVAFLLGAGADLEATGLDSGTPLHQAAWFGQPRNARLLVEAGAPLEVFDATHHSSPLGWAVHGSRYSGGAEERQAAYVELVHLLLDAGSSLSYPDESESDRYLDRLRRDASSEVRQLLPVA